MNRAMLPLTAIRAFEAAARHESFRDAALELNISASVVSRHIADLEKFVGEPLFQREVRKVQLTEVGRALRHRMTKALDELTAGILDARRFSGAAPRSVTLHVPPTFATRVILPRLPDFDQRFPRVQLRIMVTRNALKREHPATVGFDVRIGYVRSPSERESVLFHEEAVVVSSPAYRTRFAERPEAIRDKDIFRMRMLSSAETNWDWKRLADRSGVAWPKKIDSVSLENDDLALQAAIMSAGVALVERRFIRRELESGTLEVLGRLKPLSLGFYTLDSPDPDNPFFLTLADWLREDL